MGPDTDSSSGCSQARNLSWAPITPPHAAARSRVSHGPCTASQCCCLHRHTLPCATFRSPHTAGGFHFVIGCCMASPMPLPPTLWLHTLVLAP
ncbi:unnamed protein product [Staurois parvus]|uniref:Uncharacterized protein n=1 Tax=Staurois parvus TaxID=386267 RepID=A0ABN9GN85_9NEOB|nr:unnamed protein product [Staurois parvus]